MPSLAPTGTFRSRPKAATRFAPSVQQLRARLVTGATPEISRFFGQQADRIVRRLGAAQKAVDDESHIDPDAESRRLQAVMQPWYARALTGVSKLTQETLAVGFSIDDPLTRAFLRESGELITNITRTTQRAVQSALAAGQAEGESYQQLARRIQTLPEFNRNRALMVARTELGSSTNRATMLSFETSGVVAGVHFTDGEEWDERCRSVNGRIMSLEDAKAVPYLFHPNCTQARSPVTDPREIPQKKPPYTPGADPVADSERIMKHLELETGLKSRWNGTVNTNLRRSGAAGTKEWDCSISLDLRDYPQALRTAPTPDNIEPQRYRPTQQGYLHTLIHEHVHALSVGLTPQAYTLNKGLEEGVVERTTQILAREVHKVLNIPYNETVAAQARAAIYTEYTTQLEELRAGTGLSERTFYLRLLRTPLEERATRLHGMLRGES